jgi:hypothetical protein
MTITTTQPGPIATASATVNEITAMAGDAAFGRRLIQNNLRSIVVEAMVAKALGSAWRWSSADWAPYDFEGPNGIRLEVKQSAAQQTWSTPASKPSKPLFDIAARKGFFAQGPAGSVWTARIGRNADIYVFARNDVVGDQADHRDPAQWRFYVVPAHDLPATKTVGIAVLRVVPVSFEQLEQEVRRVAIMAGPPGPSQVLGSCGDGH